MLHLLFPSAFDQMSRYYADQLLLQQQAADQARRTNNADVERFRQENQVGKRVPCTLHATDTWTWTVSHHYLPVHAIQLKHTRKEWDLNRPDHLTIDNAGRVGDDDPRLGTASLQKFEGEDLSVSLSWGRPCTMHHSCNLQDKS